MSEDPASPSTPGEWPPADSASTADDAAAKHDPASPPLVEGGQPVTPVGGAAPSGAHRPEPEPDAAGDQAEHLTAEPESVAAVHAGEDTEAATDVPGLADDVVASGDDLAPAAEESAAATPATGFPAVDVTESTGELPSPEPSGEAIESLQAELAQLRETYAAAERRNNELAAVAQRNSDFADRLHAEVQRLREGEVRQAVAPFVRGLSRLSSDIDRMRDSEGALSDDLSFVAGRVTDLLFDAGVTTLVPDPGSAFDPREHHAVGVQDIDNEALDRTVAEVRRNGLRQDDGRVLQPADVIVHRHTTPAPAEEDSRLNA